MPSVAWLPVLLFAALLLAASLHLLAVSGHFPAEHRAMVLRNGMGSVILFGTSAAVMLATIAGALAIWRLAPWYAFVIGGGLAILVAPLVLQRFPDAFVNGRASLFALAVLATGLAVALLALAR